MSGIFNGDSIYKSGGGGGGGYKDGGALVDGDFIKVENNTVSNYDNTTRSDVNFYFEVGDGEVINSVVELTTTVNATIHVYIFQNGFYIPLGNVGGDTVNAGDAYNLSVVGNSFILEVVTPSGVDPEYIEVDGVTYPCKKYGSNKLVYGPIIGGTKGDYYWYQSQVQDYLHDGLFGDSTQIDNDTWTSIRNDTPTFMKLIGYWESNWPDNYNPRNYGSNVWIWNNVYSPNAGWIYDGSNWSVTSPASDQYCVLYLMKTI